MEPYFGRSLFWDEFRGRGGGNGREGGFRRCFVELLKESCSSSSSSFIHTPGLSLPMANFLNLVLHYCKILSNFNNNNNNNNIQHKIAILVQKGFVFLALVWASLIIGLPFLPLSPTTPLPFLKKVIRQVGVSVCFVGSGVNGVSEDMVEMVETVFIPVAEVKGKDDRRIRGGGEKEGVEWIQTLATPSTNNWAYILTTSGTTGDPKVVPIMSNSLSNRLNWFIHRFSVQKNDVLVFKTPVAFDVSVWEYVVPLISGLCLS